jgi:hypothetical protein
MKQTDTIVVMSKYLSIITLNINGLKSPSRRHRPADLIKNTIQLFVINKKHTIQAKVHTV